MWIRQLIGWNSRLTGLVSSIINKVWIISQGYNVLCNVISKIIIIQLNSIIQYISDWNYRFPEFYTSMKNVFNNNQQKCIYTYSNSFGVKAIINSNNICIRYNTKL